MKKINLSREEKFKLLTGKNSWETEDFEGKIPSIFVSDGPHGLRKIDPKADSSLPDSEKTIKATAYPTLSLLACSWDVEAAKKMGDGIADDCIQNDVDILLAPGVNIKRTPLCGRNFEYWSEDPFLAGELAREYINGLQERGVGTSLKHFAANNAENYRIHQNCEIEERAFHEIYLTAFEKALKAEPWTIMCSYNMVNGVYASENRKLLDDILRKEFGFNGVIVSDWDAVLNRARSLKATLDLEMPYNPNSYGELVEAYQAGYISDAEIDSSTDRILTLIEKAQEAKKIRKIKYSKAERHALAENLVAESIVLLKNENDVLPLKKNAKIDLFNKYTCLRCAGGGSSHVETDVEIKDINKTLTEKGFKVNDIEMNGWYMPYTLDVDGDYQIICVNGEMETEGSDRNSIRLNQIDEEIILNVAKENPNTIVLIYAGSAVDCSRWINEVAAVVYVGFAGEAGNEAVAKILSGEACPCGKLAESYPTEIEEYSVDKSEEYEKALYYGERFYIGYRYYDKYDVLPQFPFGFGLSYAKFEYSNLTIEKQNELEYIISYDITNVSKVAGKEISEVYVHDVVCTCDRPVKELKGFSKDLIQPGETKRVSVKLDKDSFAFYNSSLGKKYVENGKFDILVGASSEDIRLAGEIKIQLPKYEQFTAAHKRGI